MWSNVEEIYPIHTSNEQSPQGASVLKEPQTNKSVNTEYRPVQPPKPPYHVSYMIDGYSTRLWIC
jgi:hypothetical protein